MLVSYDLQIKMLQISLCNGFCYWRAYPFTIYGFGVMNNEIHVKEYTQGESAAEGPLAIVFSWLISIRSLDFLQTVVGYFVCYDKNQPNKKQMSCAVSGNINW